MPDVSIHELSKPENIWARGFAMWVMQNIALELHSARTLLARRIACVRLAMACSLDSELEHNAEAVRSITAWMGS